jgi:hypothetical protein
MELQAQIVKDQHKEKNTVNLPAVNVSIWVAVLHDHSYRMIKNLTSLYTKMSNI